MNCNYNEDGQSIVLITLVFVILLAFTALAVDAGMAFVRSSQFSAAVDAAALAGVVDLEPPPSESTDKADDRAYQFLSANGWPTGTLSVFDSSRSVTDFGIPQYSITVTWPVDFYFARLIGLDVLEITHPATAAYYSHAEMYVPTANDQSRLREASQFSVGRDGCTKNGDPVHPLFADAGTPNLHYSSFKGLYRYRIRIPKTYSETDILRVELFDPDSYNLGFDPVHPNDAVITHSQSVSHTMGITQTMSCNSLGAGDSCVIRTGELLDGAFHNPFWFLRVDETFDSNCQPDPNNPLGDAITTYELYYLDDDGKKNPLASYTADNSEAHLTDLKWVTPGVTFGEGVISPTFDIDISNVPASDVREYRFVYLDVTSEGGSSKNVWDVHAGPPPSQYVTTTVPVLANDVNLRNLQIANRPIAYTTQGIFVEALGRMPTQYHIDMNVARTAYELTKTSLTPIDIGLGESVMYLRHFDYDMSVPPPDIEFTIDSVSPTIFQFLAKIVDPLSGTDPKEATCDNGTNCDNSWSYPQYAIGVPSPYAGGIMQAAFTPRGGAFVWSSSLETGRPILAD